MLDSTALLVAPQVGRNMGPSNFGLLFMATSMRESNAASLARSLARGVPLLDLYALSHFSRSSGRVEP